METTICEWISQIAEGGEIASLTESNDCDPPSDSVLRSIFEYKRGGLKEVFTKLKRLDESVGDTVSEFMNDFAKNHSMSHRDSLACFVVEFVYIHSTVTKENCKSIRDHVVASPKAERVSKLNRLLDAAVDTASQPFKKMVGSMIVGKNKNARIDSMTQMTLAILENCDSLVDVGRAWTSLSRYVQTIADGLDVPAEEEKEETAMDHDEENDGESLHEEGLVDTPLEVQDSVEEEAIPPTVHIHDTKCTFVAVTREEIENDDPPPCVAASMEEDPAPCVAAYPDPDFDFETRLNRVLNKTSAAAVV